MIEILSRSKNSVLGIHASGTVTLEEELGFLMKLKELVDEFGKINVLIETSRDIDWEPEAQLEDIKWILQNFSKIDRVSLVSDSDMARIFFEQMKSFFEIANIKIIKFPEERIKEAWEWVEN